jgi:hypothetical protein
VIIKKIGGNWHKLELWKGFIVGYKSGGIVITGVTHPGNKEFYIPLYDFSGFKIENDYLLIKSKEEEVFQLSLPSVVDDEKIPPLKKYTGDLFKPDNSIKNEIPLPLLDEKPRAVAKNDRITAVAYKQKGIDFFKTGSLEKICHFDFPGYSFIDDIKIDKNKLYIADVFGLRIINISDLNTPVLDDRFTISAGWAKDVALYRHYILTADVMGIKIYNKDQDFAFVSMIESNRNRVAKVVTSGHYAFLSCEAVGLKIADLSRIESPTLVSGIVLPQGVWDCAVYKNHAYLAAYTEGLIKIDFSDIKSLKQSGSFRDENEIIGVYANEKGVFAACSHNGFKIFDHDLKPISAVNGIEGRCWTILEHKGYLFAAVGQGGVYIYDIKNPKKPVLLDRVQTTEARDIVIKDSFLYIADGRNGALTYDITDMNNIKYIEKIPSAAFTRGIMVDDLYLYKADGDGGLEIYDR